MNRNAVFSIAIICFFSVCNASFCQEMAWETDFKQALDRAISEEKLLLLHFSAEWCRPCKQLEKFVFKSSQVQRAIDQRVVPVHLDTDTNPEFVKKYSVTEIPMDIVLTTSGRVVTRRKSPKTADNYARMIASLPTSEVAESTDNTELTQKIEQVLNSATKSQTVAKNNDFTPRMVAAEAPAHSLQSAKLMDRNKVTQLVSHQDTANVNQEVKQEKKPLMMQQFDKSKRVINDRFFVEKSDRAEGTSENDFVMEKSAAVAKAKSLKPIAEAKIDNPFGSVTSRTAKSAQSANAAKILQPNFGNVVDPKRVAEKNRTETVTAAKPEAKAETALVAKNNAMKMLSAKAVSVKDVELNVANASRKTIAKIETTASTISKVERGNQFATEQPMSAKPTSVEPVFALAGKCPVTLVEEGKWADGNGEFGCVHRGRTYIFADAAKLMKFQKDPESFSPILAGYDPVVFHNQGELVDGEAKHGVFMGKAPNQRIVLFQSAETRTKFQAEPRKFMKTIRMAVEQSGKKLR